MTEIVKVFIVLLISIGVLLNLVAALGIIRFPDVYTRNHAASKASTLGIMVILLATFLYFYFITGHFNSRILLGIVFFFLTTPVAGHIIGRAAYNSGVELWGKSLHDDLKSKNKDRSR
ncbi:MAG: monovalent cation/H(+) antiporter subunit G [Bacillus sp. (in: firmicutes)]